LYQVLGLHLKDYYEQELFEKAESIGREMLKLASEFLDNSHVEVAAAYNNLALTLDGQAKQLFRSKLYVEAEVICRKLLTLLLEYRDDDHPDIANVKKYLALVIHEQSRV